MHVYSEASPTAWDLEPDPTGLQHWQYACTAGADCRKGRKAFFCWQNGCTNGNEVSSSPHWASVPAGVTLGEERFVSWRKAAELSRGKVEADAAAESYTLFLVREANMVLLCPLNRGCPLEEDPLGLPDFTRGKGAALPCPEEILVSALAPQDSAAAILVTIAR